MATKLPEVIDNVGRCRQVVDILSREMVLGVDCEGISLGVEGPLTLIQVGNCSGEVYLFDILKNKELLSKGKLGDLLESDNTVKVTITKSYIFIGGGGCTCNMFLSILLKKCIK